MDAQQYSSIIDFLDSRVPVTNFASQAEFLMPPIVTSFLGIGKGDAPVDDLVDYVRRCLSRSTQRHVIVTGEYGVGKTTFLKSLGQILLNDQSWSHRPEQALYLDVENIGAEDSRAFLETIEGLVASSSNLLLCLDGLMSLLKRPNGINNFPMLRVIAQRSNVTIVATVPKDEIEQINSERYALQRLFTVVELDEPSDQLLKQIAESHLTQLQQQSGLRLEQSFLADLLDASSIYQMNDYYPGKLITLMTRCFENACYELSQAGAVDNRILSKRDISYAIKELTGIDTARFLINSETQSLDGLLSSVIFGQPEAASTMAREIEMFRSGLNEPGKPASVVLLAGTTGVGKTELAKAVCRFYSKSKRLNVFTMGNYTESHTVSSVIGVPPGYVGHEEGGPIVNQLLADPFSVFLLDEAEKAHANVWKPFLNLFDEGWIVDQRGRKAVATNAIFMLTTNAGERVIQQLFERDEPYDVVVDKVKEALLRHKTERGTQSVFSEQFLARINEIIVFRPLSLDAVQLIAATSLEQMAERWEQRLGIRLEFSSLLVNQIGNYCFQKDQESHQREGGRLIRKTVRSVVEARLINELRNRKFDKSKILSMAITSEVESDQILKTHREIEDSLRISFEEN